MKRRSLFAALVAAVPGVCMAFPWRFTAEVPTPSAFLSKDGVYFERGRIVYSRASQKVGSFTYTTFTVTDPVAFLKLTFPAGMLFWRGALLLPGVQYDVQPSGGCKLRNLALQAGDTITVVTT